MKKAWVLSYPLTAQRRRWSDWADAQADLSPRWAHSHCVGFVMSRLKLEWTGSLLPRSWLMSLSVLHHNADYKNLTWMWGADRKFRPEGRCLASRDFAKWCKTVIPRNGIFFPHRTLMFDSFSCLPFDFRMFYFKSSIYYHTQWRWRGTFF